MLYLIFLIIIFILSIPYIIFVLYVGEFEAGANAECEYYVSGGSAEPPDWAKGQWHPHPRLVVSGGAPGGGAEPGSYGEDGIFLWGEVECAFGHAA